MTRDGNSANVTRRDFVRAGVVTVAALPLAAQAGQPDEPKKEKKDQPEKQPKLLPTRVLGRTGAKVTILGQGATGKVEPRMMNAMFASGIRYIDTADCYVNGEHEKGVGEWIKSKGNRKDLFVVTKDHPNTPDEFVSMIDKRLENFQSDYIDLYFVHGLGEPDAGFKMDLKAMIEIPKSKEWAAAAEKLKKSGKAKYIGFAMHGEMPARLEILKNAVAGGWTDAIMLMYDPQLVRENKDFNKALDECHQAGIGLVSMKHMRRLHEVKKANGDLGAEAAKILPKFKKMGLTPYQAVLHAVWTDERIACICSGMQNLEVIKENAEAARNFHPMDEEKLGAVHELYRSFGRRYCTACDGSCRQAAGTQAALNKIARYLAYFEADGARAEARRLFAALTPEQRSWHDADLAAASKACHCHLDYAAIITRAEQKLA